MNRVTVAIILFFGTALYLYWQVQVKQGQAQLTLNNIKQPDFEATQLRSSEYNEQGILSSRVTAEHMEHYQDDNLTLFTQPVYFLFSKDKLATNPWRIRADLGQFNDQQNHVTLQGKVQIKAIDQQEPLQSVNTDSLLMDLTTKTMTTDNMVYIEGKTFTSQGKGMFADKNSQTIRLNSQVTGIYEAQ